MKLYGCKVLPTKLPCLVANWVVNHLIQNRGRLLYIWLETESWPELASLFLRERLANCWSKSLLLARRWPEDICCCCGCSFCCWYKLRSLPASLSSTSCSTAQSIQGISSKESILMSAQPSTVGKKCRIWSRYYWKKGWFSVLLL